MNKFLLACLFLCVSYTGLTKEVDLQQFNQQLHKNMQQVIEDNPQMYETRKPGRAPASVTPVIPESPTEQLDEVEEQADTHTSW